MKTISGGMDAHLQSTVTTLCTCWKVTRADGERYGFTDHDRDLTIGGIVYKAATGYYRTAITTSADTGVDNMDVSGFLDDASLNETELRNGAYDYATVEIFAVNWNNLNDGIIRLRYGLFGEVMIVSSGFFKVELRGLTQLFAQTIGEVYAPECRADLGDHRCKVQLVPNIRRSLQTYNSGARIIVPQSPGQTYRLPVRNPSFEILDITGNNAWGGTGYRVWNKSEDDYLTPTDHYYAETTGASGSMQFYRTVTQLGEGAVPTDFEVDLNCVEEGHSVRLTMWWGMGLLPGPEGLPYDDEDPDYYLQTSWITPSEGTSTISIGGSLVPAPIPTVDGASRLYYRIEWSGGGEDSRIQFNPYPIVDDEVVPTATLEPQAGAYSHSSVAPGWTLASLNGLISGPNVWMSPAEGNWHLVHARPPGGPDVTTQTVILNDLDGLDFDIIDAGGFNVRLSCQWGAETTGVKNAIRLTFLNDGGGTISTVEEEPQMLKGKGFWEPHDFVAQVPPNTRRIRIGLCTYNYTNNARARGVFDAVGMVLFEPSVENQDSYLVFGMVEFVCSTPGITAGEAPAYDYTLGAYTSDGTAVFQAVAPLHTVTSTITEVTDHKTFKIDNNVNKENSWFEWGVLEVLTGQNIKKKIEVKAWNNTTKQITLALPLPYVPQVGDKIRMHTGCAKSREVCVSKFNNIYNYRGEPDLPGTDQYFKVGGANSGSSVPDGGGGKGGK